MIPIVIFTQGDGYPLLRRRGSPLKKLIPSSSSSVIRIRDTHSSIFIIEKNANSGRIASFVKIVQKPTRQRRQDNNVNDSFR